MDLTYESRATFSENQARWDVTACLIRLPAKVLCTMQMSCKCASLNTALYIWLICNLDAGLITVTLHKPAAVRTCVWRLCHRRCEKHVSLLCTHYLLKLFAHFVTSVPPNAVLSPCSHSFRVFYSAASRLLFHQWQAAPPLSFIWVVGPWGPCYPAPIQASLSWEARRAGWATAGQNDKGCLDRRCNGTLRQREGGGTPTQTLPDRLKDGKMWADGQAKPPISRSHQPKVRCTADKHCLRLGLLRYCRWAVKDTRNDGWLQISPELQWRIIGEALQLHPAAFEAPLHQFSTARTMRWVCTTRNKTTACQQTLITLSFIKWWLFKLICFWSTVPPAPVPGRPVPHVFQHMAFKWTVPYRAWWEGDCFQSGLCEQRNI